jgi:gamma-glutamylcyclotransferase (GGCT)/AIG2-like uncharacterized protein YtfP
VRAARVFVYGTLMRGGTYHHLLAGARFIQQACTAPRYVLVDLGDYPALLDGGETRVAGEIYEVPEEMIAMLDALEGHPDYYRRTPIALDDGSEALGYVFVDGGALASAPTIEGGRWMHKCR